MTYDHNNVWVQGRPVLHSVARTSWVCGICGSRLVTRFCDESPHWRTVCAKNPQHHPDQFVHQSRWAYIEAQQRMDAMIADDVLVHLPPELQTAITQKGE